MTQICDHGNSAIAISLSAYIFAVGTLLSGLFRDLRQLGAGSDAEEEVLTSGEEEGVTQFTNDIAWVGIGFAMMLVAQLINDFVLFHACEPPPPHARRGTARLVVYPHRSIFAGDRQQ